MTVGCDVTAGLILCVEEVTAADGVWETELVTDQRDVDSEGEMDCAVHMVVDEYAEP